jgi:uncharacterized protein with von Willebrand factor type A (vWA) domain
MTARNTLGGIVHTYQKYDPRQFPSPTQPPPDLVSGAFEHMLAFGNMRELTDEELARAVRLDPRQFAGLGPSLDALMAMLRERKRKILATYETDIVQREARRRYRDLGERQRPPPKLRARFQQAFEEEQVYDLERLWYRAEDDEPRFARQLLQLMERLGDKYQIDELAGKYQFTGRTALTIPQALEIKEELETIDRLLKQLEEAAQTAQLGVVDLSELAEFAEPGDIENLNRLQQQIEEYLRSLAESQGLDRSGGRYQLTPKAYRLFQGRLLERIFSNLVAARSGRHTGPVVGEGAVELQRTKQYEFGDSLTNMDMAGSLINALVRAGPGLPVRLKPEDIEIHRTRNTPKCATVVLMDMSGSMRYDGLYVNVKRMALALQGLIRKEYPGDFLQFLEIATFAKPRQPGELVSLLPKMPTLHDPVVRLRADMSRPDISELQVPQHFTNIQHGLQLARQFLSLQDTPNRQVILITDGLPTAHFEGQMLYLLYPPDAKTEKATLREGGLCQREGITINIFLLPTWSQSREDIRFAYRLAESTRGRVFFTAGSDLDRYVVWDYVQRKREILT